MYQRMVDVLLDNDGVYTETDGLLQDYYVSSAALGDGMLAVFGQALGIDEDLLLSKTTNHFSAMAAIHYPALTTEPLEGQLRCGAHQDSGTLTIVFEDADGLEVLPRGSNVWQQVECPKDGLIVNLGDLMTIITNGRWESTPHRVRLPNTNKYKDKDKRETDTETETDKGRLSIAWYAV